MKNLFSFLITLVSSFSLLLAQDGSDSYELKPAPTYGRKLKTKMRAQKKKSAQTGKITGQCTLIADEKTSLNAGSSPCMDIALKLIGGADQSTFYTRTEKNGHFEFMVPDDSTYKLESNSHFYKIMAPQDPIKPGHNITVKLQLQ